MHDPISLLTFGRPAFVEDQSLLQPDQIPSSVYLLIFSCCFPVAGIGGSVCPQASWVLPVLHAEEVPLVPYLCAHCRTKHGWWDHMRQAVQKRGGETHMASPMALSC